MGVDRVDGGGNQRSLVLGLQEEIVSSFTMDQVPHAYARPPAQSGLGYAQVISAILGPLVEGGVATYAISQQSKQSKTELKQRQRELIVQQKLAVQQLAAQERTHAIAQQAAIQQAQIAQARAAKAAPFVVGAVGLGVAGLVLATLLRSPKKKRKRKKRRR